MLLVDGTGFASDRDFPLLFGHNFGCGSSPALSVAEGLPLFCLPLVAVAMRVFVGAGLAPRVVLAASVVVEGSPFLVAVILSEAKELKRSSYRR